MVRERGGPAVAARQGPVTEGEYQPDTTVVPLAPIAEYAQSVDGSFAVAQRHRMTRYGVRVSLRDEDPYRAATGATVCAAVAGSISSSWLDSTSALGGALAAGICV